MRGVWPFLGTLASSCDYGFTCFSIGCIWRSSHGTFPRSSNCSLPQLFVVRTEGRCHATPRLSGLHAFEESIELLSQSIEFRLRSFLKTLKTINRNQDCAWRVVFSDDDSRAMDRPLEQTSKLVLCFGRCVGSPWIPEFLVMRDISLLSPSSNLLGCVMIFHDGSLAIMAKIVNVVGLIACSLSHSKKRSRLHQPYSTRPTRR